MKHWRETALLLDDATRLAAAGQRSALATVVRIVGSAFRRPGAKLLVAADGTMTGSVSGGCLEADVREVSLAVLQGGPPRRLRYETGSDDQTAWGLGLGCNGSVEIFVQPAEAGSAESEWVRRLLRGERPFAVSTVIGGVPVPGSRLVTEADGTRAGSVGDAALVDQVAACATARLAAAQSGVDEIGAHTVFTEVLLPPPTLIICGAGDDAAPLAVFATEAGFRVTIVDHRPAFLATGRYPADVRLVEARPEGGLGGLVPGPDTYVVVKTHSLANDREWTRQALLTPASYVGLLGPRSRGATILGAIGAPGNARVFAPVGLDLAAEGAEQIAVSIVAELLVVRSGREPRHLRERATAIHGG